MSSSQSRVWLTIAYTTVLVKNTNVYAYVTAPRRPSSPIRGRLSVYVVGEPAVEVTFSTGLVFSQSVVYTSTDGLLSDHLAALVIPEGRLDLDVLSEFTNGAEECPP